MLDLSDAHHTRKLISGMCMMFAPLCLLAGSIVEPAPARHEATMIANAAAAPDRFYIATLLFGVGVVLLLPALLGLMHMLRERETALGHLGGAMALFGFVCAAANTGLGFVIWRMTQSGTDRAQMVSLLHGIDHATGTFVPLFLLTLLLPLGI